MRELTTKILHGDSKELLKTFEDNSIDLIVTSPHTQIEEKILMVA
jgi:DNA modification methylase